MPPKKKRGSCWEHRPRRASSGAAEAAPKRASSLSALLQKEAADSAAETAPKRWRALLDFAPDLWSSDYAPLLKVETDRAARVVQEAEQTAYRRRLKGEKAEAYDSKMVKKVGSALANLDKAINQRNWTFSLIAKSVSWYNQRVPHRIIAGCTSEAQLASRSSCLAVAKEMLRPGIKPALGFTESPHVFVIGTDQTFMWRGHKKRTGGDKQSKAGTPPHCTAVAG